MMKNGALIFFCFLSMSMPVFSSQRFNFSDLKKLSEATTAQLVFDQAVNISANFGLWQKDSELSDFFNKKNHKSFLCGPTTIAHYIIYHMAVTHRYPITANVPGVSLDLKSIDANQLILDLAIRCKTDFNTGTNGNNLVACVGDAIFSYFGKTVTIDRILNSSDPLIRNPSFVNWQNRNPDFSDIKSALDRGEPVIASIDWKAVDPSTNAIVRNGGHIFPIYGYASQNYFGNNLLQLAITDPDAPGPWSVNDKNSDYNIVTAFRERDQSGYIFLDGRGFSGQTDRAYLKQLIILH